MDLIEVVKSTNSKLTSANSSFQVEKTQVFFYTLGQQTVDLEIITVPVKMLAVRVMAVKCNLH